MKGAVRFSGLILSFCLFFSLLCVNGAAVETDVIDTATAASGYFTVCDRTADSAKMKVGVTKDGKTVYYDYVPGESASYSFTQGDGVYTVTLFRNVSGTKYRRVTTAQVEVNLASDLAPYLASTAEITFAAEDAVGRKAAEVCAGAKSEAEKIVAIHNYVSAHLVYDHDFAARVLRGEVKNYTPDTAAILESGKGVCYDFSALFAAMCRSQGIPCAIARGTLDGQSHAWNMVWADGSWHAVDMVRASVNGAQATTLAGCYTDLSRYGYAGGSF